MLYRLTVGYSRRPSVAVVYSVFRGSDIRLILLIDTVFVI